MGKKSALKFLTDCVSPGVFRDHLVNSKDFTRCKFSLETIGCMGGFIFFIVGSAHPNKTITKISSNKRYIQHPSVYEFSVPDVKGYKL